MVIEFKFVWLRYSIFYFWLRVLIASARLTGSNSGSSHEDSLDDDSDSDPVDSEGPESSSQCKHSRDKDPDSDRELREGLQIVCDSVFDLLEGTAHVLWYLVVSEPGTEFSDAGTACSGCK